MEISKAVITAAGRGARQYPASDTVQKAMLPLVDRDGLTKPVLQIIAEEALESGIEEICVVAAPGDEDVYRHHFRNYAANLRSTYKGIDWAEEQARRLIDLEQRLTFAVQPEPEGYGHAVWCARSFVAGGAASSCCSGDHLYISSETRRCARQLIDLAVAEQCAVSAVQATREHLIHQYGTLTGRRLPQHPEIYASTRSSRSRTRRWPSCACMCPACARGIISASSACTCSRRSVFDLLDDLVATTSASWDRSSSRPHSTCWRRRNEYLALETRGSRFNLGVKFGVVEAQIALALAGVDRERMLTLLLESVIELEQQSRARTADLLCVR